MDGQKGALSLWVIVFVIVGLMATGYILLIQPFSNFLNNEGQMGTYASVGSVMTSVTGVLRTSGLSDEEKALMGLSYANFQVADLKNRKEGEIAGYYLESEDSEFVRYQGKCVRVIGTVKEGWQDIEKQNFTVNKQDTYQRSVLIPSEIEPLKYSTCNPYAKSVSESLNKVTLKGTIIRGVRPAPDIGYDYQLKLDEPYLDKSSFSGSPEKISTLDVAPSNNSLWETLEKSIGKKVKIEGFLAWGYSETRYLKATSVK